MPKLTFEEMIEPGRTIRIFYNKGNINNRRIHIRKIVDGDVVVYAYWRKYKHYWDYAIYYKYFLKLLFDDDVLFNVGKNHYWADKEGT